MRRKLTYVAAIALGMQIFGSCKSYLDVNPHDLTLETAFYQNSTQAFQALVAVYDMAGNQSISTSYMNKTAIMNVASDDHWAGGASATDIGDLQSVATYSMTPSYMNGAAGHLWKKGFTGIYRADVLLSKIGSVPGMDDATRKRYTAEAKFLRAYFYFDLVRFFKAVPLILTPTPTDQIYTVVQSPAADIYAQIYKDIAEATPDLPVTVPASTEGGRVTQGTAHALLGRIYLWQKDYAKAVTELADVNGTSPGTAPSKYGYQLVKNFKDLFDPKKKFSSESIFELVYNSTSNTGWGNLSSGEGNQECILVGPRGYSITTKGAANGAPDYISGWSGQPYTDDFYNFIHFDPRKNASVADLDSLEKAGLVTYQHAYQNTGHFIEKWAGRNSTKAVSGQLELNFPLDFYEIRLADTYLMEAEAIIQSGGATGTGSRAYQLLNAVRARVGLNPVAATMDNIKKERRAEFAGEGLRWLDLVRWGDAATKLGYKGFVAGKNEIFPIPVAETYNSKIEQTKEWGGTK
ncbi:RagB/SusD family nutrient uptake outer membrane protein [Mucilaginibacter sp. KACC 22063]|uniref:RagB/SusD family nutrient uptake outer membrane protein n=1 Tax=Mucilaginibacter sp. KACC 22063 TaxID=3025666 RepID=UPI002366D4F8|nr:RagB/SusD family nutrient uptake outer membrane protein [Mucilaginibacter sp. KACC 22063]WDF53773.1 RagB/SusD family nutrient uptake outer membrane protein [Mucilaginibacter sp. KACC 22063]